MVIAAELDPADSIRPSAIDLEIQVGHWLNARKRLHVQPGGEIENTFPLGLTPRSEQARTQIARSKRAVDCCPLTHAIERSVVNKDTDPCVPPRYVSTVEPHASIEVAL